jgi:hypothetical protein
MIARRTAVWVFAVLLAAGWQVPAAAQNAVPIPGMAPGTQNGVGSPFSALSKAPGAELFSGSATTAIAIEVPPGRVEATPKLELAYSSAKGRSPYGHGWSLDVGRVSRSTKHGVPSYSNTLYTYI